MLNFCIRLLTNNHNINISYYEKYPKKPYTFNIY